MGRSGVRRSTWWGVAAGPWSAVLALVIQLAALPAQPARAATITVTTKADQAGTGAACSLREAILSANGDTAVGGCASGSGSTTDRIVLPAGRYALATGGTNEDAAGDGDLDVTESVTIQGAGRDVTVVDGSGDVGGERVFQVLGSATVTFSDMTIRNGHGGAGGGILNAGRVTLRHTTVSDNVGDLGGGVSNPAGTLHVIGSAVSDNLATQGGGIYNAFGGSVSLTKSVVSGNVAFENLGGGISSTGGSLSITDSTVSGNDAVGDLGGGIFHSMHGVLTIVRSTITGNRAGTAGGGILHNSGTMTMTGSTVSGNFAGGSGGGIGLGDSATIVDSTISGNRAAVSGGGIQSLGGQSIDLMNDTLTANWADWDGDGNGDGGGFFRGAGAVVLVNTVLAGNHDGGNEAPDCSGDLATQGFNLVGVNTSCISSPGTGDRLGTTVAPIDARFAPLENNGGPTSTHALLPGSPAIGNGSPLTPGSGGSACPSRDQRGVPRSDCDIGAYELAQCFGHPVNVVGTSKADAIRGSPEADVVLALGGNDVVDSGGGDDRVCAGPGNDRLTGGGGDDRLAGHDGRDSLDGGPGTDVCVGGPGLDSATRCEHRLSM
jgi:CSLREA domain-containing protein